MENQTKVNIGLLALIVGFITVGLIDFEPTHYCLDREVKAYCYELSSTNKTCYTLPAKQGRKICYGGWEEIPFIVEDIPTNTNYEEGTGDWICPPRPEKCYSIK